MKVRVGAAIALLVLATALVACEVITGWLNDLTGGGSAHGYSGARVSFSLEGNVARSDAQSQATLIEAQTMIASFEASGTYDAASRTFTATWDGGEFSNTSMVVRLNQTEESVVSFEVRQTRSHSFGAWTEVYELAGHDILLFHRDASSTTYLLDGSATSSNVDAIDYRELSKNVGSSADPYYRLAPPQLGNIWSVASSYIEVELFR